MVDEVGMPYDAVYVGCWCRAGHYAFLPGMSKVPGKDERWLAQRLDSRRWQAKGALQGEAKVTHLEGWTILSFPDYSVDVRPGSHSTFALRGSADFEAALKLARVLFPQVFERFTFDVVLKEGS